MNDFELLHEYAAQKSEDAFATLVKRYGNVVYSAALRQTHNPHTAEEVTQAVFIILARKSSALSPGIVLSGWLLRTTHYVALNTRRRELHRLHTEQEIMNLNATSQVHHAWNQVAPLLDEALANLGERDRNALALRFFEQKSLKEVGEALGLTEDGAQKRVSRAVEKLRAKFAKRGLVLPSTLIAGAIMADAVQAAPSALMISVITAATSGTLATESVSLLAQLAQAALETAQLRKRVLQAGALALTALTALLVVHQLKATSAVAPAVSLIATTVVAQIEPQQIKSVSPVLTGSEAAFTPGNVGNLLFRALDSEIETPIADARLTLTWITDFPNRLTNVSSTDLRGECLVPIDRTPVKYWNSRVEIFKDGYVPKYVSWSAGQGDAIENIPMEYTAKLARAVDIGGTVVNAKGEPVPEARVVFSVGGPAPGASPDRERLTMMGHYHTEVTDAQGRWHCNHVPSEFGMIDYEVSHPDYVMGRFGMAKLGTQSQLGSQSLAEEDLRNGTAQMLLKTGLVLAGVVTDEAGMPIKGAKVTRDRNWREPLANQRTESDGRFLFSDLPEKESSLTVQAEGFAPLDMILQPTRLTNELMVVLSKGAVLRGQTVDESGNPVVNARIWISEDELNRDRFDWSVKTDEQGRFEWLNAPASPEFFSVRASGYVSPPKLKLTADGTEHLIALRKNVRISGTVVDAESRQAIESFKVLLGTTTSVLYSSGGQGFEGSSPSPRTNGKAGAFSFTTSGAVAMCVLEFEAEGYWPVRLKLTGPLTNDCQFALELKRGANPSGTVQLQDGSPVAGAVVVLCAEDASTMPDFPSSTNTVRLLSPGQFDVAGQNIPHTTTDSQGRFYLPLKLGIARIVAAHKAGYGETSFDQLTASRTLVLYPWGRVEGTLRIGNRLGSGETIVLDRWNWRFGPFAFTYAHLLAQTDSEGQFVIEGVPPGDWKISRLVSGTGKTVGHFPLSQSMHIEVKAGQTTPVTLGGIGRAVTGRIKVRGLNQPDEWLHGAHRITTKILNASDIDFCRSDAGREAQRHSHEYVVLADAEGAFKIDDVLPGTYELKISIEGPHPIEDSRIGLVRGIYFIEHTVGEIVVPDAPNGETTPCDLGVLEFNVDKRW